MSFIEGLFPTDSDLPSANDYGVLIGSPSIRQLRVKTGMCGNYLTLSEMKVSQFLSDIITTWH